MYAGSWSGHLCKVDPLAANLSMRVPLTTASGAEQGGSGGYVCVYEPSQRLVYVSMDCQLYAVAPSSHETVASMALPANPIAVAFCARHAEGEGKARLFAGLDDGQLLALDPDLSTGTVQAAVSLSGPVYSVCCLASKADGGDVAWALVQSGQLVCCALDSGGFTTVVTIELGASVFLCPGALHYCAAHDRLHAGTMTGIMVTLDATSHEVVRRTTIKSNQTVNTILSVPAQKRIYVGHGAGVVGVDSTSLEVVEELFSGKRILTMAWVEDGKLLLLGTVNGELLASDVESGELSWRLNTAEPTMVKAIAYVSSSSLRCVSPLARGRLVHGADELQCLLHVCTQRLHGAAVDLCCERRRIADPCRGRQLAARSSDA